LKRDRSERNKSIDSHDTDDRKCPQGEGEFSSEGGKRKEVKKEGCKSRFESRIARWYEG